MFEIKRANLPCLTVLWLEENPICLQKGFFETIVNKIRTLKTLDKRQITPEDRNKIVSNNFVANDEEDEIDNILNSNIEISEMSLDKIENALNKLQSQSQSQLQAKSSIPLHSTALISRTAIQPKPNQLAQTFSGQSYGSQNVRNTYSSEKENEGNLNSMRKPGSMAFTSVIPRDSIPQTHQLNQEDIRRLSKQEKVSFDDLTDEDNKQRKIEKGQESNDQLGIGQMRQRKTWGSSDRLGNTTAESIKDQVSQQYQAQTLRSQKLPQQSNNNDNDKNRMQKNDMEQRRTRLIVNDEENDQPSNQINHGEDEYKQDRRRNKDREYQDRQKRISRKHREQTSSDSRSIDDDSYDYSDDQEERDNYINKRIMDRKSFNKPRNQIKQERGRTNVLKSIILLIDELSDDEVWIVSETIGKRVKGIMKRTLIQNDNRDRERDRGSQYGRRIKDNNDAYVRTLPVGRKSAHSRTSSPNQDLYDHQVYEADRTKKNLPRISPRQQIGQSDDTDVKKE
ncbi:MAG: hypothetical protein EZS28_001109 [Streblomastix strix]|uniref:Uncharacterized protein n=1 Tax=Streblomastix strix TaxID=222440 RepID=A0A5J4X8J7_9EUKA|nr:MAG: hypothetical protein EZS28_001109 [Streblomastix strix]